MEGVGWLAACMMNERASSSMCSTYMQYISMHDSSLHACFQPLRVYFRERNIALSPSLTHKLQDSVLPLLHISILSSASSSSPSSHHFTLRHAHAVHRPCAQSRPFARLNAKRRLLAVLIGLGARESRISHPSPLAGVAGANRLLRLPCSPDSSKL